MRLVFMILRMTKVGKSKLNNSDMLIIEITYVSLPEQTKMANFLSDIDKIIQQIDKGLSAVKEFKKGLLQ